MQELTQLGGKTSLPSSPDDAIIECIPFTGELMVARFQIPEWSGLCPVTGQPDLGRIVIDYVPKSKLIESKSLKLFSGSFRNHGCFHEKVTQTFFSRLQEAADPYWLRVCGFFAARGGISIDVFMQSGDPPKGLFIPPLDLNEFRGR